MNVNQPGTGLDQVSTIVLRFDIDQVDGIAYGIACWRLVWECIDPIELGHCQLFDGDSFESVQGYENVFCIGIQSSDAEVISMVRERILRTTKFQECAAETLVDESVAGLRGLHTAGRVDKTGELIGSDAANARSALGEVKLERRRKEKPDVESVEDVAFLKPASDRVACLPEIATFHHFRSKVLGWGALVETPFTPEELCDIAEDYGEILEFYVEEYSCPVTESMLRLAILPADSREQEGDSYIGMFPFASENEAFESCRSRLGDNESEEVVMRLLDQRGIEGRWLYNFETYGGANRSEFESHQKIAPSELRSWLYRRAKQLGMPIPSRRTTAQLSLLQAVEHRPRDSFVAIERVEREVDSPTLDQIDRIDTAILPAQDAELDVFRFPCGHCGKRLKATKRSIGKTGTCKHCGGRTIVQEGGKQALPRMRVQCPECGKKLSAPSGKEGKLIDCPACACQFRCASAGSDPSSSSEFDSREESHGDVSIKSQPPGIPEHSLQHRFRVESSREKAKRLNDEGIAFAHSGNPAEGIRRLLEAVDADPSWGVPWSNLSAIYRDEGNSSEALKCLENASRLGEIS